MRRMTASCCASFCPKYARRGCTMFSSFEDDGRHAAEVRRAAGAFQRRRSVLRRRRTCCSRPGTSPGVGSEHRHRRPLPRAAQVARLIARVAREVLVRAKLCGIDEDRGHHVALSARAVRTSDRWPSCRKPIVGTSPTSPSSVERQARKSATVRKIRTAGRLGTGNWGLGRIDGERAAR